MKAFVTGGSGFIGRQLIRKLIEREYDVYALARSANSATIVEGLGATAVPGDINDVESMRPAMAGSDVVFHVAAWYRIGDPNWTQAEIINVGGTRKVLRLAYELAIPRIIYTSTIGVFGDTYGQMADETYYSTGPFATEYERTKWLAHYRVAVPLMEQGAPITIVMPGGVYGPGDTSIIGDLMTRFYLGQFPFPFLPGPETTLTYAHVEDIAEGHILALEKGRPGESYLLAGPAVPLGEMINFWSQLTGKRTPAIPIPSSLLRTFSPIRDWMGTIIPVPPLFSGEMLRSLGATYMARSDKARTELEWQPRSLQSGMLETFGAIAAEESAHPLSNKRERDLAKVALGAALALLFVWLFARRRRK